ncbi:hypothetical protein J7S33_12465 [Saccharothrix algeriensis]|uniref:Uncharacterized protein n=1 Tax=Saccharothrix algeriensis TaxID=173560 RepID=A0A8T8I3D7_9PSEU|nr:hypothetical protein J7S33_12465 [Saccharothrix algeriensis]
MATEAYEALDRSAAARSHLELAAELLGEVAEVLARALSGAGGSEPAQVIGEFSRFHRTAVELAVCLDTGDRRIRAWIAREVGSGPGAFPVPPGLPPRQWRGLDAVGHARQAGRAIGRAPRGNKKQPIREVRSLRELDGLFSVLAVGAVPVEKPTYVGWLYEFPDRSTIGYRTRVKTTVEPTIEIVTPDGVRLKIHVNAEGWDQPRA